MANKKGIGKKGGFALAPITLREPVKVTDGFTNLVETPASIEKEEEKNKPRNRKGKDDDFAAKQRESKRQEAPPAAKQIAEPIPSNPAAVETVASTGSISTEDSMSDELVKTSDSRPQEKEIQDKDFSLSEGELLRILDADSLDEIYELSDVLRASSLKLYATLVRLADSRGRARVKNHELMSKAGIKGIATLYKQERWLMDLKLLEKKAKPGPHDGSSYVVHKLETLPLPAEIYEKFDEYLSNFK